MATMTLLAPTARASVPIIPPLSPPTIVAIQAVLALDLGTTTGWALRSRDGHITSGTVIHRNDRWQGGGMRFLRFRQWLTEIKHTSNGLDQVLFEEVRRHAGVDAAHAYGGWLAILSVLISTET